MVVEFWIETSIIAVIKTNMLDLGRRAVFHHINLKFLATKMSDIAIICKLLVISSLVQIENILKIPNLQNILTWRSSTCTASLKVSYKFYLFSSMSVTQQTSLCFISSIYTLAQKFCNMNILILIYSRNLLALSIRSFNYKQDDYVWSSLQKVCFTTTESPFGT